LSIRADEKIRELVNRARRRFFFNVALAQGVLAASVARYLAAIKACKILGPEAADLTQQLGIILNTYNGPNATELSYAAGDALGAIGPDAVVPLVQAMTNSQHRMRAVISLGFLGRTFSKKLGPSAKAAVPSLILCLDDPDSSLRYMAASALGAINSEPQLAVPALIRSLADTDSSVRFFSAVALGDFESRATTAVPTLLHRLDLEGAEGGDLLVATAIMNSLSRITNTIPGSNGSPTF
jgi:HEAT repeat protein